MDFNLERLESYVRAQAELVQKYADDKHLREAFYYQGQGAINYALWCDGSEEAIHVIEELELWYQQNAAVIVFPWMENEVS